MTKTNVFFGKSIFHLKKHVFSMKMMIVSIFEIFRNFRFFFDFSQNFRFARLEMVVTEEPPRGYFFEVRLSFA